jgi:hypothetical protein
MLASNAVIRVARRERDFNFNSGETHELKERTSLTMNGAHLELKYPVKALDEGRMSHTIRLHRGAMDGDPIESKLQT